MTTSRVSKSVSSKSCDGGFSFLSQWEFSFKSELNTDLGNSLLADYFSGASSVKNSSVLFSLLTNGQRWASQLLPDLGEYLKGSSSPRQIVTSSPNSGVRCRNFVVALHSKCISLFF